jgi:hypothetical protein
MESWRVVQVVCQVRKFDARPSDPCNIRRGYFTAIGLSRDRENSFLDSFDSKMSCRFQILLFTAFAGIASIAEAGSRQPRNAKDEFGSRPASAGNMAQPAPVLPALPDGVAELKFGDFFKTPVGPRGLELTEKLTSLHGKRVRVLGYQVVEAVGKCNAEGVPYTPAQKAKAWFEASVPGRLLLCAVPYRVNFAHYGHAEDLPPQVLYVHVAEKAGEPMPQTPGLLLLTGILEVGPKTEADGRVSVVRMKLDPPEESSLSIQPLRAGSADNPLVGPQIPQNEK